MILNDGTHDGSHLSLLFQDRYAIEYLEYRRRCNGLRPRKYNEGFTGIALTVDHNIEIASPQRGCDGWRHPLKEVFIGSRRLELMMELVFPSIRDHRASIL